LAGTVAVQISQAFQEHGLLVTEGNKQYGVTADGRLWFERFGIILDEIKSSRSGFLLVSVWIGPNGRCLWALRARDLLTATGFWLYQAPGHGASIEQPAPQQVMASRNLFDVCGLSLDAATPSEQQLAPPADR
jgi:hypothetical protein